MKNILLIISLILYFVSISIINEENLFLNLSIVKLSYALSFILYIFFFICLVMNDNLRFKWIYKLIIILLVWVVTELYRDAIYNYNDQLINFFYQGKGFNLFYLQMIFIGCYLLYAIYSSWNDPRVKCPNCKKLNDFERNGHEPELLDMDTNKELTHGRITNSGKLDRRFNSELEVTHTYTYKAQCIFCSEEFNFIKQQSFTENA